MINHLIIKKKSIIRAIIRFVVSSGLVLILLLKIKPGMVASQIIQFTPSYIFPILILFFLNYSLSTFRWKMLIIHGGNERVTFLYLLRLYFSGTFLNNFLPTSVGGDLYKVYRLGRMTGSLVHSFSATLMERFTGLVVLLMISWVGLIISAQYWIHILPSEIADSEFTELGFYAGLVILVPVISTAGFYSFQALSRKFDRIEKIYRSIMQYRKRNKLLFWTLATSLIVQLLGISTQYLVFVAMGIKLSLPFSISVLPLITMAGVFIPSLNGIGVQDFLYIHCFKAAGIPMETALAASVAYHIFRMVASLPGGVFFAVGISENS